MSMQSYPISVLANESSEEFSKNSVCNAEQYASREATNVLTVDDRSLTVTCYAFSVCSILQRSGGTGQTGKSQLLHLMALGYNEARYMQMS